jgi:hypothetical protein
MQGKEDRPMGLVPTGRRRDMTLNLKTLAMTLLALCAFGAVAASGASAFAFHSEKEKTIITAEHDPTSETLTTFGTKSSTVSTTCKKKSSPAQRQNPRWLR